VVYYTYDQHVFGLDHHLVFRTCQGISESEFLPTKGEEAPNQFVPVERAILNHCITVT